MKENGGIEGRGGPEHTNNRAGRRIHDEACDDARLRVQEIEAEKLLPLPDAALRGRKRVRAEGRPVQSKNAQRRARALPALS